MSKRTAEDSVEPAHEDAAAAAPASKVPKTDEPVIVDGETEGETPEVTIIEPPNGKSEPPKIPHTIAEITEGDNIQPDDHDEPQVTEPETEEEDLDQPSTDYREDSEDVSAQLPDETPEATQPLPDVHDATEHGEEAFNHEDHHLIDETLEGEGEGEVLEGDDEDGREAHAELDASHA